MFVVLVALPVAFYLLLPIFYITLRLPSPTRAVMTVPEATMDKNRRLPFPEHYVRSPGQITGMQPIAVSHRI